MLGGGGRSTIGGGDRITYLVLAGHLDIVDRIRPEGELGTGGVREEVTHETAAGYLPCDQALP